MPIPLRVLHLASGNLFGGIEIYLRTLARRGNQAGLEGAFTVCWEGRLADELRSAGAEVHRLGEVRLSRPWQVWSARRRLSALLRRSSWDLVVVHSAWTHALLGTVVNRSGLPLVMGVHTGIPTQSRLERWARRIPLKAVYTNSRYTAGSTVDWYPGHRQATVIYYPVEPILPGSARSRALLREELGAGPNECVFIQASRMQPWKGIHTFVEGLIGLDPATKWKAWIVGGAQRTEELAYEAELKARISSAGLSSRVVFLGQRADVPELLSAADVHVQLNENPEPFGIVFVEAAYAGIPSISADTGGAAEFIDDTCGIRLATGDRAGLIREMNGLLREPDRRRRLGDSGPKRAREICDPDRQLQRIADFWRTCV